MRWRYHYTQPAGETCFRLMDARLCLGCEVIFEAEACPVCGSESFVPVSKCIQPLQPAAPSREVRGQKAGSRRNRKERARDPVSLFFHYLRLGSDKTHLGKG